MSNRNHTFDFLCGLCILRMVWLHVMSNTGFHHESWWQSLMQWSYYFMCFFFFKAGYFNKSITGDSRIFCIDKVKRLLVPYLSWGAIGCTIYLVARLYLNDHYNKEFLKFRWDHVWTGGAVYGNPPLWFLLSFFLTYIVIHFIEKVPRLHWVVLLFPALSYWLCTMGNPLFFGMNNVPMGIFFFFLGHVWHQIMQRMSSGNVQILSLLLLVAMVVVNLCYPGRYDMNTNTWSGSWLSVWTVSVLAMCGFSGVLLTLPLRRVPWICFIGEHSMVFFVSHYIMINVYKYIHFAFNHWRSKQPDQTIIMFIVVVCLCCWLVPYVERVSWLSGRWKKVEKTE